MESLDWHISKRNIPANDRFDGKESFATVEFLTQMEKMLRFLTSLQVTAAAAYTPKDIYERAQRIGDAADTDLHAWVMNSNPFQWRQHPSFYHALIGELRKRKVT